MHVHVIICTRVPCVLINNKCPLESRLSNIMHVQFFISTIRNCSYTWSYGLKLVLKTHPLTEKMVRILYLFLALLLVLPVVISQSYSCVYQKKKCVYTDLYTLSSFLSKTLPSLTVTPSRLGGPCPLVYCVRSSGK